ncbi:hypothetical protein DITRI_Ditri03aG0097300 [Diplodiscus trichospermus]
MTLNRNTCSHFLITLWILLIIQSSLLINAEMTDYQPYVDAPNSWTKNLSFGFVWWERAGVKPILLNGMFICGFHCSLVGDQSYLFAVSIFPSDSHNPSLSPRVVWSANRNNPVEHLAQLQLTPEGGLILKDGGGVVVWSANRVGKSISRLNLSAEGNLMLFDKTNNLVWQSFDYPTDSLVLGQRLVPGQKLRANASSFNSSEGLYAFAIINGKLAAYMDFGRFGSLSVPDSADFIQLGSDGHLRAYELKESNWEVIDLFQINRCDYPLACGKYGVCVEGGCCCPYDATQSQTSYFRPANYKRPDLGCFAISPISCELSSHHSLLDLGMYHVPYDFSNLTGELLFDVPFAGNGSKMSEIFSIRNISDYSDYENYYIISAFIKVQNFPTAQNPNKNLSLPEFHETKRQDVAVILGSTLGVISELKNVTKNFSNKLGEGGFGSVFQGTLPSGSEVAVKHLDGFGPVKKSFIAEVQTIGSIHHFSLVSLVGFCAEKYSRLLVYEYMCKGSLDQWIFHKNQDLAPGWQIRKKIITDIAKGLAYLHEDCNQKVIHLDIKPQNILLDENFNAKVSDFGLSKLIGRDQSQVITTMRGTPGYMAPEWLSSVITEKVDVYSFGIVVLEILCGRKNVDPSQHEKDRHLLSVFRRKQEEGQLVDLVDKCSEDMQSNAAEVVEMMKVGAWCLQAEYGRRPSMSTVVKVLEGSVDFVGNLNENFLDELTVGEAVETFASTVLPSMLSGPR